MTVSQRDALTPRQRLAAYGRGEIIDRLPAVPIVGNTAARVRGVKVSAFRGNGKLIAEAQIAAYQRFGYDNIRIFTDLYTQAEAMGATVVYLDDETAYLGEPALQTVAAIDTLRPADPTRDGHLPTFLEAMRRTVDAVGDEVAVTGAVTGPLTNASFLIGTERLVRLMIRQPEAVHRLCQLSLETSLRYIEEIFAAGCVPSLTDAMSSSTVISPKAFAEFSFPYLKQLIDAIHAHGATMTLHICGKTSPIWELMADTGADCLSLDNAADLAAAKQHVGQRVRLMGNVQPSEVMLEGTPARVRAAVLTGIQQAYDAPRGYIVASGCSLPTETPFANIDAMMQAVREIGYPVIPERLERLIHDAIN